MVRACSFLVWDFIVRVGGTDFSYLQRVILGQFLITVAWTRGFRPQNMQQFTLGDDYIVDRCLHSPLYFYRVKTVDSGPQRTRAAWALARARGSLGPWQMMTCVGSPHKSRNTQVQDEQALASIRTFRLVDAALPGILLRQRFDSRPKGLSIYSPL